MKKPTRLTAVIAAFLLIPFILPGSQIDPEEDNPPFPTPGFGAGIPDSRIILILKDKLNLTDLQTDKIQQQVLESETRVIRLMAELKIAEIQLAAKIRRRDTSRKQITDSIRAFGKIHYRIMIDLIHTFLDIRAMLTTEQLTLLAELRKKREMDFPIPPL